MFKLRQRRPAVRTVNALIPPRAELPAYARRGGFRSAGKRFLDLAVAHGLEPDHRVLDLGCGVGRFAVALSEYLDVRGQYVGLDASKEAVAICNRWIGSRLPRFTFIWADVSAAIRNPRGGDSAQYRFPFEDERFDFVFSNSLFTHLVPSVAWNYFGEIGRVLRLGGRTVNTIFLLNRESLSRVANGASHHGRLRTYQDSALIKRAAKPEAWIAHDERLIRRAHAEGGLAIEGIRYGSWSGRPSSGPGFGAKDIVVASRIR